MPYLWQMVRLDHMWFTSPTKRFVVRLRNFIDCDCYRPLGLEKHGAHYQSKVERIEELEGEEASYMIEALCEFDMSFLEHVLQSTVGDGVVSAGCLSMFRHL